MEESDLNEIMRKAREEHERIFQEAFKEAVLRLEETRYMTGPIFFQKDTDGDSIFARLGLPPVREMDPLLLGVRVVESPYVPKAKTERLRSDWRQRLHRNLNASGRYTLTRGAPYWQPWEPLDEVVESEQVFFITDQEGTTLLAHPRTMGAIRNLSSEP